jgi:hypothetical protein
MSFLSKLAKIAAIGGAGAATAFSGGAASPLLAAALGAGGSALGAMAKSSAQNRGVKIDAGLEEQQARQAQQNEFDRQQVAAANSNNTANSQHTADQIAREKSGMETGNNAYANTLRTDYALNRNAGPSKVQLAGGKSLNIPALVRPELSADAKGGMTAMRQEMLNRMQNGNAVGPVADAQIVASPTAPTPYTIDPKNLNAGTLEQVAGIAGAGLQGYSALDRLRAMQQQQQQQDEQDQQRTARQVEATYGSAG